jgi:hypothetical protein
MTSARKRVVRVFAALSSLVALILVGLASLPYTSLRAFADRLVADGELESFTPHVAQALRIPWAAAGVVLLFTAAWSILRPGFGSGTSAGLWRTSGFCA